MLSGSASRASTRLRQAVERNRAGSIAGLALFALSPLPSAQLFIAAGVTGVRLLPLTAAFFVAAW